MKQLLLVTASLCLIVSAMAQADTTRKSKTDTIRIGNHLIIVVKEDSARNIVLQSDSSHPNTYTLKMQKRNRKSSNVSTNWFIIDLGFNNYTDNTNYASAAAQQFAPGATKDWFKLRNGKSVNVNFWFFMQRLNVVKHVVNLKYGLGLELNNYRYKEDIVFNTDPTRVVKSSTISYNKNKLAADYVTVPLMLNFDFTPNKSATSAFGLSVGVSGGYRYASRQKFKSSEQGKTKNRDDFDLRPYKLSYIAELKLGPVQLYGSKAMQSMFENGLDQTPYAVGLRFSNW